jgi:hypothetical protein
VLADPLAQEFLQTQPAFVALQSNPKFRAAVSDPALQELVRSKQWAKAMANEKVVALIFDRDARKQLNKLQPKVALAAAAERRAGKKN